MKGLVRHGFNCEVWPVPKGSTWDIPGRLSMAGPMVVYIVLISRTHYNWSEQVSFASNF